VEGSVSRSVSAPRSGEPPPASVLAAAVRDALARREDPAKAARMQACMKSALPFRGVDAAGQRDVARDALAVHPPRTREEWLSAILALWRDARYREERYLAIALARRPLPEIPHGRAAAGVAGVHRRQRLVGLRGSDRDAPRGRGRAR
jgi:hypothetical protein